MFRSTYLDDGDACHECQVCGAEMWFAERLKGVKKNEMPQFGDFDNSYTRDIIVKRQCGKLQRIDELHMAYLPLQYPLIFPYGDNGYNSSNQHALESLSATKKKRKLTPREYLAFQLMRRKSETSVILHGNKLLQQFIVDGYSMVESDRLDYIRKHQKELRVDLYSGITDALTRGETDPSSTGRRVILPSSFTGGARYMIQNYQDAMAICAWAGNSRQPSSEEKENGEPKSLHSDNQTEFKHKRPSFEVELQHTSTSSYLNIPLKFAREHIKESQSQQIKVTTTHHEKVWKLGLLLKWGLVDKKEEMIVARLTQGWKNLVNEYNLHIGDICKFELIQPTHGLVFHLQVFRHVKKAIRIL
ncbi:hypothetical protein K1719_022935 [Acacia pycnantha]|nr:hypothetical protein K1719_022935 [Acacia pycnantha]